MVRGQTMNILSRSLFSRVVFLYLDEKELENMNKEGWRVNKHVELWVKNAFDQWRVFHSFDMKKSIINLSKDEYYV
jgi:hypothetical protein